MAASTREGKDDFGTYIEEETGRGWRKIRRERNGITFAVYGAKTEDYINAMQSEHYYLKMNEMNDRIELNGKPITDAVQSVILNRLKDLDLKDVARMRDTIRQMALENSYHPIKQYLADLKWDGKQHIEALYNKLSITTPGGYAFFRKFLLGSIAKILDHKQNYMLVLVGAQRKGKSKLARWLCPLDGFFHEGPIAPDNKDCQVRLISNWLWEVAELDATTKRSDRSALKFFITQEIVKVRVPYGQYDIEKPAVASMIGTVNDDGTGFLSDPTGDRRFAVLHLEDIDWSYTNIDVHQIWAEAYHCYKEGESHELTLHEQEIQHEVNNSYQTVSPLEELLLENFVIDPSSERFMSTMGILDILEDKGLKGNQFQNKMELGAMLTKHGLARKRQRLNGKPQYGYVGIYIQHDEITVPPLS
jgi:predicted P-loop ATPase